MATAQSGVTGTVTVTLKGAEEDQTFRLLKTAWRHGWHTDVQLREDGCEIDIYVAGKLGTAHRGLQELQDVLSAIRDE
ncbi:hypothetical protein [Streptomyces zaomyceticus]|uniref:hypothetical protein n=1 Tax=Streptomyces zaomyceticus TaxID=68286 RepID=UPI003253656E